MGTPSTDIGPGLGAFIAFFVLAVLLWLLMRNMNARMRRMAYRERERIAALEASEHHSGQGAEPGPGHDATDEDRPEGPGALGQGPAKP